VGGAIAGDGDGTEKEKKGDQVSTSPEVPSNLSTVVQLVVLVPYLYALFESVSECLFLRIQININ